MNSQKDQLQKAAGNFFLLDEENSATRTAPDGTVIPVETNDDDQGDEEEVKQAPVKAAAEWEPKPKKGKKGK